MAASPGTTRTPESRVDPEELVARAVALRPRLRELQGEHEQRGGYGAEIDAAFRQAGLYRVLHPRRFGGLQQDLETFLRVGIEISRGDPAVGWSWVLTGAHVFHVASLFPQRAQVELLDGRDLIAPAQVRPSGRAVPCEEGHRLSGTWGYCSGSTWSTDVLVTAFVVDPAIPEPTVRMFAVPRENYTVLDDWGGDSTLGMAASGSNSVRVDDVFVPDYRSIPLLLLFDGVSELSESVGATLHDDPMYLGRNAMLAVAELAASQVGAAWAAVDEYEQLMHGRTTSFPPFVNWIDSDDHHRHYGTILSLAGAAEELLRGVARRHQELCRAWTDGGEPFSRAEDLRLRGIAQQAARLACDAVDLALTTAGTSAARHDARLAKYHRDVTMCRTHIMSQVDTCAVTTSKAHLDDAPR